MKKAFLIPTVFLVSTVASLQASIVISNFGSDVTDEGSGWVYDSGTSSLSGTEVIGSYLTGLGAPYGIDISGTSGILLSANVSTDPGSLFTITFEDPDGRVAIAPFQWSAFSGGASVFSAFTTIDAGFTYVVDFWTIDSGNSGNAINASFSSVQAAIPEPTAAALLGLGLLGLLVRRRRA